MSEEINYKIDNCITDLDTLKVLDKRAMEDLENNTHKIEQQEVLTIIREFIRLKNDYDKEKEKNMILEGNKIGQQLAINTLKNNIQEQAINSISKDKIREIISKYININSHLEYYNQELYGRELADMITELLEEGENK